MALDELEHARLAKGVCEAAGAEGEVSFDPHAYAIGTSTHPAVHVAAVAVPNLCLGETLALRIAHRLRANATVPAACAALDRVVRDEPRHGALGWETLDWLLDTPTEAAVRDAVEDSLPTWVAGTPRLVRRTTSGTASSRPPARRPRVGIGASRDPAGYSKEHSNGTGSLAWPAATSNSCDRRTPVVVDPARAKPSCGPSALQATTPSGAVLAVSPEAIAPWPYSPSPGPAAPSTP